jgi:cellulose synthase/poly-beta-1,6-N-acetylglucosamine synthase-like glycosyltransferase
MSILIKRSEKKLETNPINSSRSVAVLILANNESNVIVATVESVRQALDPQDAVFVIADNCQDDTALRAAAAGAIVFERQTGTPYGKGAAIKWLVHQAWDQLGSYELLVILDADNRLPSDFMRAVKEEYSGEDITQCLVLPVDYQGSSLSTLITLSEIHEQKTIDSIRTRLGWSVRLRGTGMVIPPHLLKLVADEIDTEVEDFAMSLLFVARGIKIRRNNRASVLDPKPRQSVLASRQRARWFRGQMLAFWRYRREILQLIKRGPIGWAMLDSLFMKPRWLIDMLLTLLAILLIRVSWFLAGFVFARVFIDLLCLIYTIMVSKERTSFLKAILHVPGFIWMWLRGILLAFQKSTWLRVRD